MKKVAGASITIACTSIILLALVVGCKKDDSPKSTPSSPGGPDQKPSISEAKAVFSGQEAATFTFNLLSDPSTTLETWGVFIDTLGQPEKNGQIFTGWYAPNGSNVVTVSGLKAGKMYYVRSFARNDHGTGLGPRITFTTLPKWQKIQVATQYTTLVSNSSAFYAATPSNILRSTDDGKSWVDITGNLPKGNIMDIYPAGNSLFATTTYSIYRSDDGGVSWAAKMTGINQSYQIYALAAYNGLVLMGTDYGYVYKSLDNGNTWTQTPSLGGGSVRCLYVDASVMLAGTSYGIYRSTDQAGTWTQDNNSQYSTSYVTKIIGDGKRLYCSTGNNVAFLYSVDGGASWNAQTCNSSYGSSDIAVLDNMVFTTNNGAWITAMDWAACSSLSQGVDYYSSGNRIACKGKTLLLLDNSNSKNIYKLVLP